MHFTVIISLFVIDRIVKYFAVHFGSYSLNTNFLFLFQHSPATQVFTFFVFAFLIFLWYGSKLKDPSIALILAGGISNSLDIFSYKGVIDPLHISTFYFNIADIMIWWGVFGKMKEFLYTKREEIQNQNTKMN